MRPLPAPCPGSGALPLRTVVEIALVNNVQILAASSSVRIAEQQVREVQSGVYPQVSAEASYLRSLGSLSQQVIPDQDPVIEPDTSNAPDNVWTASLKLNQTVIDFRVFAGFAAAGHLLSLRGEERRGAAHQVVDLVRQSYFDVLLAAEQEALTEQSIARVRQTLRETRAPATARASPATTSCCAPKCSSPTWRRACSWLATESPRRVAGCW